MNGKDRAQESYLAVGERRSGRTLHCRLDLNAKIGERLSDHGGFSISEPFFEVGQPANKIKDAAAGSAPRPS